ncbi:MAG: hypothetical protein M5U28_41675 [Sandaracinaceae bacterium]|nr:hypothetical protein [Sandaracinaceae bacterium]
MDVDLLDDRFFAAPGQPSAATAAPRARSPRARPSRQRLEHLLREHRGQIADVAHATGHSRRQVYRWLEKYGLDLATYRDPEEVD